MPMMHVDDHESKRHKDSQDSARRLAANDDTVPLAQEPASGSGVKRSDLEAIRRADAEAEKALKATPEEMDTMLVAAEAVLTETCETVEALSKEQARQKQFDFLESMKVYEEVYEDDLLAGTHVMSGRWVDTMKIRQCGDQSTLREFMRNQAAMKVALQQQQQYRASVCFWQGVSTNEIRDTKLLWQTAHKLFSTLKSA